MALFLIDWSMALATGKSKGQLVRPSPTRDGKPKRQGSVRCPYAKHGCELDCQY